MVSGKVKHSQKLSASPLQPWVAVEKEGLVICAHCNCIAGLGEACSHVVALLFLLEADSQLRKTSPVRPSPVTGCLQLSRMCLLQEYICDIDFTRHKRNKKLLYCYVQISCGSLNCNFINYTFNNFLSSCFYTVLRHHQVSLTVFAVNFQK